MLLKCCTHYASKFGKLSSGHRTGKCQFWFQVPKKDNAKECSNYSTIVLISNANKVMLKILKLASAVHELWTSRCTSWVWKRQRNQRSNFQHQWVKEKARKFLRHLLFASLTMLKPLTVWISVNCRNFLKCWEYHTTLPGSWEISLQIKSQQLEPDMKKTNWFQIGKGVCKGCLLSPCLF